jgi:hypothetical protein
MSIQRAANVDRSFHRDAMCRTPGDTPALAWTAESKRKYPLGGQTYTGEKLIELACEVCRHCPVQWECVTAAIEGDERAGTWSAPIADVRWLGHKKDWRDHVTMARSTGVSVQRLIVLLRSRMT